MPILLTTPFNPGDLDKGHTYPLVNIVSVHILKEQEKIAIEYQFGSMADGVWTPGPAAPTKQFVVITEDDYAAVVKQAANSGELIYEGVKRVLYQYLLDKGIVAGTIQ